QAFVQALYNEVLGRTGNLTELNGWVTRLHQADQSQVAHEILYSPESFTRVVDGLYHRFLSRPATPRALDFWVWEPHTRVFSLEAMQANICILNMRAFRFLPTAYMQALYNEVLGRTGNSTELASWYSVLGQANGFQTVATDFANSLENRQNTVQSAFQ